MKIFKRYRVLYPSRQGYIEEKRSRSQKRPSTSVI